MTCQHEDFEANVEVGRISAGDGGPIVSFVADITIMCADCRQSFGFRGLTPGMPADEPGVSPDAVVARLPLVSSDELEVLGPLAALSMPSGLTGYTIGRVVEPDE